MGLFGCGNHCCDHACDCPRHCISKANDQGIHAGVRKGIEREESDAVMRPTQEMRGQPEHEPDALLYRDSTTSRVPLAFIQENMVLSKKLIEFGTTI